MVAFMEIKYFYKLIISMILSFFTVIPTFFLYCSLYSKVFKIKTFRLLHVKKRI